MAKTIAIKASEPKPQIPENIQKLIEEKQGINLDIGCDHVIQ